MKVLPGFEPGLLDSKSRVITNYTIRPRMVRVCMNDIPDGIRTRNLKIRSLAPYPLGHGDSQNLCMLYTRHLRDSNPRTQSVTA